MGAAEQQQFSQYPVRYGDGTLGAAIAQTRGGKDELVTPVALWELDDTSGLYLPPGLSANPRRPRVDAQLSGSNENVIHGNHDDSAVVAPGAQKTVNIFATPGWIAHPILYGIVVPAVSLATTGTHSLIIALYTTLSAYRMLQVTAAYNQQMIVRRGVVTGTVEIVVPEDEGVQATTAQQLAINGDIPFVVQYTNNTDADQTETRIIRTIRHERAVVN